MRNNNLLLSADNNGNTGFIQRFISRARNFARHSFLSAAAMTVGAAALLAPASAQAELSSQNLLVTVSLAPPFVTIKHNINAPEGVDVALVKELQRRTGFTTDDGVYDLMSFGSMMELDRSGQADIVAGALTASEERARFYEMTEPYVYNSVCIVTRKGDNIENLDDLAGRTLAVQNGTDMSAIIGNISVNLHEEPTNFMTFYAVSRGLADALIIDDIIAREYIAVWPQANLQVSGYLPDSEGGIALFFKKDSPNSKVLKATFDQMMADGTVDRIVREELRNYFNSQSAHAQAHQASERNGRNIKH